MQCQELILHVIQFFDYLAIINTGQTGDNIFWVKRDTREKLGTP